MKKRKVKVRELGPKKLRTMTSFLSNPNSRSRLQSRVNLNIQQRVQSFEISKVIL